MASDNESSTSKKASIENLPNLILQQMIDQKFSEVVGAALNQSLFTATKGMRPEDVNRAKIVILAMTEEASEKFFRKMRARLDSPDAE